MTWDRPKMTAFRLGHVLWTALLWACFVSRTYWVEVSIQWSTQPSLLNAYNMISSTALPKETLSKAPQVSPNLLATLSVAWVSRPAKGTMAMAFMAKMISGFKPAMFTAMPIGTKMSNT